MKSEALPKTGFKSEFSKQLSDDLHADMVKASRRAVRNAHYTSDQAILERAIYSLCEGLLVITKENGPWQVDQTDLVAMISQLLEDNSVSKP